MYNTRTTLATELYLLIVLIRKVCVLLNKTVKIIRPLRASISTCIVLNLPLKLILEVWIDVKSNRCCHDGHLNSVFPNGYSLTRSGNMGT